MPEELDHRPLSDAAVPPLDCRPPAREALEGTRVRLEPIEPARQAESLFEVGHADERAMAIWTYLGYGPFADRAAFDTWLEQCAASEDPLFYAVHDKAAERALGMTSYLRIVPAQGVIEIGHIWLSPPLQRTASATEALFLMMRHAFDALGNRRLEWKCNALNEASRRAARRLGFRFEGVFHQHMIVKGRNRDTAWYAILDHEWPRLRDAFETWLAPDTFGPDGTQKVSLSALTAKARD